MVDAEDVRYQAYRKRKLARGEEPRAREDWRRVRGKWDRSREFGNRFRDGMAQVLGRTEERGWQKEVYRETRKGGRFDDIQHSKLRHAMEFKAGRVTKEALLQLEKDEIGLEIGLTIEWYVRPGARIDREVQLKMQELRERYKDKFRVIEVTREQFEQAIQIGKELDRQREQQRKVIELARSLVQAKEQAREQERLRKSVAARNRQIEKDRKHGRELDADKLATVHKNLTKRLDKLRDQERIQVRDMVANLGVTKDRAREMELELELRREEQRRDLIQGLNSIALTVRAEDKARADREAADKAQREREARERAAREAAEKARQAGLQRAYRDGIPLENLKLLALGQAQAPIAAVEHGGPQDAPAVERGARESITRARDQARER